MGAETSDSQSPASDAVSGVLADFQEAVEAEVVVEGEPDWMVAGYGSMWVLSDEAGSVARIDPSTNEVIATVQVGAHPCTGVAAGFGSIWVPSCGDQALYRIDARTDKVVEVLDLPVFETFKGVSPLGGIAAGEGAVWMVTRGRGDVFDTLARIDPGTNQVTEEISLGYPVGALAVARGAVWAVAPEDDLVLRVEPGSGKISEVDGLAQPAYLAADEDGVWVISGTWPEHPEGDGSVSHIDPVTNEVVASVLLDEIPGNVSGIAMGEDSVWARSGRTALAEIDPVEHEIVARYEEPLGGGAVAIAFGSVWLSDVATDTVWRLSI